MTSDDHRERLAKSEKRLEHLKEAYMNAQFADHYPLADVAKKAVEDAEDELQKILDEL